MSLNFSPLRLIILIVCAMVYYFCGGFSFPEADAAWIRTTLVFGVGAILVSIIDHRIGLMEPVNIRWVYMIVGAALMALSIWWIQGMKAALLE